MTTADRILFGSAEKHSSQQSELAAGGTAIGTGFNTPPQFSPRSQRRLPS
jgi:fumarate hydratase class II